MNHNSIHLLKKISTESISRIDWNEMELIPLLASPDWIDGMGAMIFLHNGFRFNQTSMRCLLTRLWSQTVKFLRQNKLHSHSYPNKGPTDVSQIPLHNGRNGYTYGQHQQLADRACLFFPPWRWVDVFLHCLSYWGESRDMCNTSCTPAGGVRTSVSLEFRHCSFREPASGGPIWAFQFTGYPQLYVGLGNQCCLLVDCLWSAPTCYLMDFTVKRHICDEWDVIVVQNGIGQMENKESSFMPTMTRRKLELIER